MYRAQVIGSIYWYPEKLLSRRKVRTPCKKSSGSFFERKNRKENFSRSPSASMIITAHTYMHTPTYTQNTINKFLHTSRGVCHMVAHLWTPARWAAPPHAATPLLSPRGCPWSFSSGGWAFPSWSCLVTDPPRAMHPPRLSGGCRIRTSSLTSSPVDLLSEAENFKLEFQKSLERKLSEIHRIQIRKLEDCPDTGSIEGYPSRSVVPEEFHTRSATTQLSSRSNIRIMSLGGHQ